MKLWSCQEGRAGADLQRSGEGNPGVIPLAPADTESKVKHILPNTYILKQTTA